ncbi:MAG TPA: dihydrofolate reductase family protein [Gemmatimonadaceae bacterium]|jgi:dihydrofolate reductase|nr:dihydrofolate reductase family protein [Gemmatimonadaceae bacterium]
MRRVRYSVAMSLDGYIAGPNGESDWILMDPEIDFAAMFRSFDTVLLGRRTYELTLTQGGGGGVQGMKAVVFSRTLRAADHPGVTLVADDAGGAVAALRAQPGRDIWLMGGGVLFRSLLDAGQVDAVEIALIPVLLGAGIPMLPPPASLARLRLTESRTLEKTGTVMLQYAVERGDA